MSGQVCFYIKRNFFNVDDEWNEIEKFLMNETKRFDKPFLSMDGELK